MLDAFPKVCFRNLSISKPSDTRISKGRIASTGNSGTLGLEEGEAAGDVEAVGDAEGEEAEAV